jgi:hypothetical protein
VRLAEPAHEGVSRRHMKNCRRQGVERAAMQRCLCLAVALLLIGDARGQCRFWCLVKRCNDTGVYTSTSCTCALVHLHSQPSLPRCPLTCPPVFLPLRPWPSSRPLHSRTLQVFDAALGETIRKHSALHAGAHPWVSRRPLTENACSVVCAAARAICWNRMPMKS